MTKTRIKRVIISALLCIVLSLSMFTPFLLPASAAFTKDTGVIADLQSDASFDVDLYPANDTDFSLKVFQLAEGESGDIYIYVYQPSASVVDITATAINISNTGTAVGLRKCELELVDKAGVFHKYKICGMTRLNDFVRKYFIVSIYRPWNESFGDITSDSGTVGVEKACPIETIWTATTAQDGTVTYFVEYSEDTITVTSEVLGNIFYHDKYAAPVSWTTDSATSSHYLAFSTNKPIDVLKKVYIDYDYYYYYQNGTYKKDETGTRSVVLSDEDVFQGLLKDSIFYDKYSYQRIQDTGSFLMLEGKNLDDSALNAIAAEDWILRYAETSYLYQYNPTTYELTSMYTKINAVSMLRMEYIYNDKYYDVGVIADVLTEDDIDDGYVEAQGWWQKIMMLLSLIIIGIVVIILFPIIKFIFDILLWAIKGAFFIALWFLTAPFRLIAWFLK